MQTEVIRPSTIGRFADGSWYLEKLRWTGWGFASKVAHAKRISSASNGNPFLSRTLAASSGARSTAVTSSRFPLQRQTCAAA